MPSVGTSSSGEFYCATEGQRTLKGLKIKRKGQPVLVLGHINERKGQEASFELFNERLAVVRFADGVTLGFDPSELLLPTLIDDKGVAYFEVRSCQVCAQLFPLTAQEARVAEERTTCPDCAA